MRAALFAALPALFLASCAGYRLGGVKPASLASVKTIAVPMVANETLHPRAEALATSAISSALTQDGTYKLGTSDNADAVLEAKLVKIDYSSIRGSRLDTLLPEELRNKVQIRWVLVDAADRSKTLASGTSNGESQLFVDSNLQTARNNALPDALERAAQDVVSSLANGY